MFLFVKLALTPATFLGMASLPFGTLLQAKQEAETNIDSEEDSSSESDSDPDDDPPEEEDAKPTHWKIAADRKAVPKRVTKTAYEFTYQLIAGCVAESHLGLVAPQLKPPRSPSPVFDRS